MKQQYSIYLLMQLNAVSQNILWKHLQLLTPFISVVRVTTTVRYITVILNHKSECIRKNTLKS